MTFIKVGDTLDLITGDKIPVYECTVCKLRSRKNGACPVCNDHDEVILKKLKYQKQTAGWW